MPFDFSGAQNLPVLGQPPKTVVGTAIQANSAELWELRDGWAIWTPTYFNLTPGNGTVTTGRHQVADLAVITYTLVLGSTSVIGNFAQVGSDLRPFYGSVGDAGFYDASETRWYPATCQVGLNGEFFIFATTGSGAFLTGVEPFVWTTGDILTFTATASNAYNGKVAPP